MSVAIASQASQKLYASNDSSDVLSDTLSGTLSGIPSDVSFGRLPFGLAIADTPEVLADIYADEVAIAVWRRSLTPQLNDAVASLLNLPYKSAVKIMLSAVGTRELLQRELPQFDQRDFLIDDLVLLVEMFCCLFDQQQAGLRLAILDSAMCPRFHVDRIPCRLVTTYGNPGADHGTPGTEWLPHTLVDRTKLGLGNGGLSDADSGLYNHPQDIQQLVAGDVALLKGELWDDTQGHGLVHRSPAMANGDKRLLVTLDFG